MDKEKGSTMKTWVVVVLLLAVVFSVIVSLILDAFDIAAFLGIFISFAVSIVGFLILKIMEMNKKKLEEFKGTMDYCFRHMNEVLERMPGIMDVVEWNQGVGRRSEVKYFFEGGKKRSYRSFFGFLKHKRQPIVVIYDIENNDVARYYADPKPAYLTDHFYQFRPFQGTMGGSGDMMQGRYGPYNRYGRYGHGIHIDMPNGGEVPDDDFVNRAVGAYGRNEPPEDKEE